APLVTGVQTCALPISGLFAVVGGLLVVTDSLQCACPIAVRRRQPPRLLVALDRRREGIPPAGRVARDHERVVRRRADLLRGRRTGFPRQVRVVTQRGLGVVVCEQVLEFFGPVTGKLCDPGRDLRVGARTATTGQPGIRYVAHQGVLEDVLGLALDRGGGTGGDEPATLEAPERLV